MGHAPVRRGQLGGGDRSNEPAEGGLTGELKDPARHRHGVLVGVGGDRFRTFCQPAPEDRVLSVAVGVWPPAM